MKWLLSMIAGYLIGSFSTGIVITRFFAHKDIRSVGSGNPGATNILRVMGKKYAALTFVLDFLKGMLGAYIGRVLTGGSMLGGLLGGFSAVLGHNFPIYFGFHGGKGISTSFGALIFLFPVQALCGFAVFVLITVLSKYVSAGSISAAVALPLFVLLTVPFDLPSRVIVILFGALAIYRHKPNIIRLLNHSENKISFRK
ncbi:MAG: glycerol-3-phosphate 1-O-acyltransferase PlsY [Clostridia bacterium]|nr:glycerol-3-phosphate 1-O-acyltransferase PlsY [Clostridia bacterium]